MAMTRKHYLAIADAIKRCTDDARYPGNLFMDAAAKRAMRRIVYRLSTTFIGDNPRFDRVKFEEACGVQRIFNTEEEFKHLDDPINLEAYERSTSKQKRRAAVA
jgi:hypothetical protein